MELRGTVRFRFRSPEHDVDVRLEGDAGWVNGIREELGPHRLIVRSSALSEDEWTSSSAGRSATSPSVSFSTSSSRV